MFVTRRKYDRDLEKERMEVFKINHSRERMFKSLHEVLEEVSKKDQEIKELKEEIARLKMIPRMIEKDNLSKQEFQESNYETITGKQD